MVSYNHIKLFLLKNSRLVILFSKKKNFTKRGGRGVQPRLTLKLAKFNHLFWIYYPGIYPLKLPKFKVICTFVVRQNFTSVFFIFHPS